MMAAAAALGSAVKAIPALVFGILPGAGRGSLLKTASTVIMSILIMVFAVVFVAAYLLVVRSFFNTESGGLMEKFVFVDIVLLVGLVMFRRGIKRLRKLSTPSHRRWPPGPAQHPPRSASRLRSPALCRTPQLQHKSVGRSTRVEKRSPSTGPRRPPWRDCSESHRAAQRKPPAQQRVQPRPAEWLRPTS